MQVGAISRTVKSEPVASFASVRTKIWLKPLPVPVVTIAIARHDCPPPYVIHHGEHGPVAKNLEAAAVIVSIPRRAIGNACHCREIRVRSDLAIRLCPRPTVGAVGAVTAMWGLALLKVLFAAGPSIVADTITGPRGLAQAGVEAHALITASLKAADDPEKSARWEWWQCRRRWWRWWRRWRARR